jgi:hypothetical protein
MLCVSRHSNHHLHTVNVFTSIHEDSGSHIDDPTVDALASEMTTVSVQGGLLISKDMVDLAMASVQSEMRNCTLEVNRALFTPQSMYHALLNCCHNVCNY